MLDNTQKQMAYGAHGKNLDFVPQDMAKSIVFSAGRTR
jgi:hypothetical protein